MAEPRPIQDTNTDCDERCAVHAATCDGFCDHLSGHRNACLLEPA